MRTVLPVDAPAHRPLEAVALDGLVRHARRTALDVRLRQLLVGRDLPRRPHLAEDEAVVRFESREAAMASAFAPIDGIGDLNTRPSTTISRSSASTWTRP